MAAAVLTLASCDINDYPEFDDANAFVAIQTSSASVSENGKTLSIPVMLTSLSGITGSVDFTITPDSAAGAQEGVHFSLVNSSKTLNFSQTQATDTIKFNIIDNEVFGGDVMFTITLTNPQGAQLGANKACTVKIEDDEHPLAFILGTMHAVGYDYFSDGAEEEWDAVFSKDASDLSKVWITGICSGGCSADYPVYGIVNDEKTEIRIPVDQMTAANSSYDVKLEGWRAGSEGEESIASGDFIYGKISADGTITIEDWFGAHAYESGTTSSAGWYAIEMGAVFKK